MRYTKVEARVKGRSVKAPEHYRKLKRWTEPKVVGRDGERVDVQFTSDDGESTIVVRVPTNPLARPTDADPSREAAVAERG